MRSPFTKRCDNGRAFTLLELLVVLAIGSLLAAVAVPAAARAIGGNNPARSLREVQSELAIARAQALKQAAELEVLVSIQRDTIELSWPDEERTISASWVLVSTEPTEPQCVRFSSTGMADTDALEFREKEDSSGMIWTLPFDPISGTVGRAAREKHMP